MSIKIDDIVIQQKQPTRKNVVWYDGKDLKIPYNGIFKNTVSPITDEELDEILYGNSYYYYSDQGIGTWDIDEAVTVNNEENEISS